MKAIDALNNVNKSEENTVYADYEEFCRALDVIDYSGYNEKFNERMKGYFLKVFNDTDTWVGTVVYYMDDKLVAISHQSGRKSDTVYKFISQETADEVRTFIQSIMPPPAPVELIQGLYEEIPGTYTVSYCNQITSLDMEGFVHGKECTVIGRHADHTYKVGDTIDVRFKDGSVQNNVPIKFYDIKIHTI